MMECCKNSSHGFAGSKLIFPIVISVLLLMGCTERTIPTQPNGPFLSAREAENLTLAYLNNTYSNYTFIIPFNLSVWGSSIQGLSCAWKGMDAGNATIWHLNFDSLIFENYTYQRLRVAGTFSYKHSQAVININHNVMNISYSQLNQTIDDIQKSNIHSYLTNFDSYSIYKIAEKARGTIPPNSNIGGVRIILQNDTINKNSGMPVWMINWHYEGKTGFDHPDADYVYLDFNGQIRFIDTPR